MKKLKFRVLVNNKWIYSFADSGKDRLGWFFTNYSGMDIKQYIGQVDTEGNEIYEN